MLWAVVYIGILLTPKFDMSPIKLPEIIILLTIIYATDQISREVTSNPVVKVLSPLCKPARL